MSRTTGASLIRGSKRAVLTEGQRRYLESIPDEKRTVIVPCSQELALAAQHLIEEIRAVAPGLPILFLGAAALGIPGQVDIDVYVLSPPADWANRATKLERVLGPAIRQGTSIRWEGTRDGYRVDLYLSDPAAPSFQEQVTIFEILRQNPTLRDEYARLKQEARGRSFREYQRRKYEFYNRVLGRDEPER